MPVTAVARLARRFDGDHCTHVPAADRRQQSLEARPCDASGGYAEIVVNDHDLCSTECTRPIPQSVLPTATLVVVAQLVGGGLSYVYVGAACQMLRADLGHRHPPVVRQRLPWLATCHRSWLSSSRSVVMLLQVRQWHRRGYCVEQVGLQERARSRWNWFHRRLLVIGQ